MDAGKTGSRPPECVGVDDATLARYVEEVVAESLGMSSASGSPSSEDQLVRAPDVATSAGCAGYTPDDELTLFARENGTCTVGDVTLSVTTFHDNTLRDQWLEMADPSGGWAGEDTWFAKGDRWVISGVDLEAVMKAAKAAGGLVR
jgi:hypothetical protein